MEIANFGVEEWLNVYETQATLDIAQSTIASMTMSELMAISPDNGTQLSRLSATKDELWCD